MKKNGKKERFLLKCLCMSKKNCTFATKIAKTTETMAQETLNSLITRAEEGVAEIQRGECYTNEEVFRRMIQRISYSKN